MKRKWSIYWTTLCIAVFVNTNVVSVTAGEFTDGTEVLGKTQMVEAALSDETESFSAEPDIKDTELFLDKTDAKIEEDYEVMIENGIIYKGSMKDGDRGWCWVSGYTEEVRGKEEIIVSPFVNGREVSLLDSGCFKGLDYIKYLSIPGNIEEIRYDCVDSWEGVTIRCAETSVADSFARQYEILYDYTAYPPYYIRIEGSPIRYEYNYKLNGYTALLCLVKNDYPIDIEYPSEIEGCPVVEINTGMGKPDIHGNGEFIFRGVRSVCIPQSVRRITQYEFSDRECWASNTDEYPGYEKMSKVTFEDGDTPLELGHHLFNDCISLTQVYFPSRLRELPEYTFVNCPAIKRLDLPVGLTKINKAALQGAKNLELLHIPSTVTQIAEDAVGGLENVTIYGEEGSYAQSFAARQNINFVPLKDTDKLPEKSPSSPSSLKGTVSGKKAVLTWNQVKNADGYQIYRYDIKNGVYKRLKTITSGKTLKYSKTLSVYDEGAFKIRAYTKTEDGTGRIYGNFSAPIVLHNAPQYPVLKVALWNDFYNTYKFTWNHTPLADGYQLYTYNDKTKKYQFLKTIMDENALEYEVNLGIGETKYYKIRAFDMVKNGKRIYGSFGKPVQIKTRPDVPRITSVSSQYKKMLKINWTKVKNADGYLIYRSETEKGGYSRLKFITDGSATSYTDKTVKGNKIYYYKIKAYRKDSDGKRMYSNASLACGNFVAK